MQLLYPYFLYALFAMAIPVVIHLFNFRKYKKLYFSDTQFLKEVKEQTRRRSRLKQLLLLAIRILLIGTLVLAFAQPVIKSEKTQGKTAVVSIYIDNSLSMEGMGSDGSLIELAKAQAARIAEAYDNTTRFRLLTNEFKGTSQSLLDKNAFLDRLSAVQPTPDFRLLSEVYKRQNPDNEPSEHTEYYWISDFQKASADIDRINPDTARKFRFVPLQPLSYDNIYIDSLWFETPVRQAGKEEKLSARIVNDGSSDISNLTVRFILNDVQRSSVPVTIAAHDAVTVDLPFTQYDAGPQYGSVAISDYPLTFDNRYYIAYRVYDKTRIRSISERDTNLYVSALFSDDPHIDYRNTLMSSMDYSEIDRAHCVIVSLDHKLPSGLSSKLMQFTSDGGTVLLIPGRDLPPEDLNTSLASFHSVTVSGFDTSKLRLGKINFDHILFNDVFEKRPERLDMPTFNGYFNVDINPRSNTERILDYVNGAPCYLRFPNGKGWVYLMTTPLDDAAGSWPHHALFVPTVYNTVLLSIPRKPLFYVLGSDRPVEVPVGSVSGDQVYRITDTRSESVVIPRISHAQNTIGLFVEDQIGSPGFYNLIDNNDSILQALAFNYNHRESDVRTYSEDDLLAKLKESFGRHAVVYSPDNPEQIGHAIKEQTEGIVLWPLFILISLVLLGLETALIRWWKSN